MKCLDLFQRKLQVTIKPRKYEEARIMQISLYLS